MVTRSWRFLTASLWHGLVSGGLPFQHAREIGGSGG